MAAGVSGDSDPPGSLQLGGGGELLFSCCPRELGGCQGRNGAGRGRRAGLQEGGSQQEPAESGVRP